jgi:hypothetical protein
MRFRRKKESATRDFEQFLKANNCTYNISKDESVTTITFDFQAGHFVASFRKQDDSVEITFPCIASAPMSQLDIVRSRCNDRNYANMLFKFTYTIDNDANEVNVHMSFFNNAIDDDTLKNELSAAFHFQREWIKAFDDDVAASKDNNTSDLESQLYKHQREMFLLRHMEMRHQLDSSAEAIANGTSALPLWQMLDTVSPLPDAHLLFLTVNTVSHQERIEDEEKIRNLDLRRVLTEGEGKEARFMRDFAVIDLHYTQGRDQVPRMATIAITAEGQDEHCLYSRVTVTVPPRNASRMNSLSDELRQPHSVSMLIALDRSNDKQRQQEFDYMWSDAQLKVKNNEQDSMTEEQIMLSHAQHANVAYNLYWGQQMFLDKRYYEAMLYMENVVNSLRAHFFDMNDEQRRLFMEAAYKLGFCYNELGLNKQAFYYLDLMATDGNIRHTMELVNAMANGKDIRLFHYTENVLNEVKRNFSEDEDLPDNIRDLINFLRRRRGYAFIDFNQLDQAEKIFTQMLDEEENADYAINELAYIKKLREQRGEDNEESTTEVKD